MDAHMTNDSNIMTKSEYAEARGVSKSRVSQWASAGRLVLTDDGRVLVAESDERLALTSSTRGAQRAKATTLPSASAIDAAYQARQIDNARRARSEAELAEMKAARMRGELVRTADVIRGGEKCGQIIARLLDQFPYQVYARLAAESSPDACLQILEHAVGELRDLIADEILRCDAEIENAAKAQADSG
jgi:phage terminase Nu1 subunit (DNA packaging protein)